jgi:hypothetical protein
MDYRYIDEEDLLRFMKKEEVDNVLPLFEGAAETGKIKRKSLKNWLVSSLANYFPIESMTPSYYLFFKICNFVLKSCIFISCTSFSFNFVMAIWMPITF